MIKDDGKEEINRFYDKILIGDIYTEELSKEEYYAQLHQGSDDRNQSS